MSQKPNNRSPWLIKNNCTYGDCDFETIIFGDGSNFSDSIVFSTIQLNHSLNKYFLFSKAYLKQGRHRTARTAKNKFQLYSELFGFRFAKKMHFLRLLLNNVANHQKKKIVPNCSKKTIASMAMVKMSKIIDITSSWSKETSLLHRYIDI